MSTSHKKCSMILRKIMNKVAEKYETMGDCPFKVELLYITQGLMNAELVELVSLCPNLHGELIKFLDEMDLSCVYRIKQPRTIELTSQEGTPVVGEVVLAKVAIYGDFELTHHEVGDNITLRQDRFLKPKILEVVSERQAYYCRNGSTTEKIKWD